MAASGDRGSHNNLPAKASRATGTLAGVAGALVGFHLAGVDSSLPAAQS